VNREIQIHHENLEKSINQRNPQHNGSFKNSWEASRKRQNGLNGEKLNNLPHQNQQKCVKIQS